MNHDDPRDLVTCGLLKAVRDGSLTEAEFLARFGGPGGHHFHALRKAGVIVTDASRVRLSRRHLSPDGAQFVWAGAVYRLDDDEVRLVRWADAGPPVYGDEP